MSKKQLTIEDLQSEIKLLQELLEKHINTTEKTNSVLSDVLKCIKDTNIKVDMLEQSEYKSTENNRVTPKKLIGKGKANSRKPSRKTKLDEPDDATDAIDSQDNTEDNPEDNTEYNTSDNTDNTESKINDNESVAETETTLEYEDDSKDVNHTNNANTNNKLSVKKSVNKITRTTKADAKTDTKADTKADTKTDAKADTKSKPAGINIINAFKLKFKEDEKYFNEWITDSVKEELKNKSDEDWSKMPLSKKVNLYYNYMKDKHLNVLENLKKTYNK